MEYGPKFFSESFLEGQVDRKYLAFMYIWSPTLKFRAGDHLALVGPWYHFWIYVSHFLTKEPMEGVKVYRVFLDPSRKEVMFQMNCDIWVVTFISKEW